jgi:simple sugar transport system permease protein
MARASLGTGYGLGQTLFRATPLVFTGLAVALGFRAGLFNIGAEGQLYLGGSRRARRRALGALPAPLLAAVASRPPRSRRRVGRDSRAAQGAHGLARGDQHDHAQLHRVRARRVLRPLGVPARDGAHRDGRPAAGSRGSATGCAPLRGTPVNAALLGAGRGRADGLSAVPHARGYELRAVGLNAPAAEYGGISIGRTHTLAMALSGALAGLGGVNFVLGYKHFFEQGFSAGAGFLGIAVALIGRSHPLGVVLAALFFGALSYSGLVINERVPRELVEMLQGLVILCAISTHEVLVRAARRLE